MIVERDNLAMMEDKVGRLTWLLRRGNGGRGDDQQGNRRALVERSSRGVVVAVRERGLPHDMRSGSRIARGSGRVENEAHTRGAKEGAHGHFGGLITSACRPL